MSILHATRANAFALAKQSGIKVVWERSFAPRINRQTKEMFLPMPEGLKGIFKEEDVEDVIYGLMVHEISHENFTSCKLAGEGLEYGDLIRSCHNVLEDIYIESKMSKKQAGLATRLKKLSQAAERAGLWTLSAGQNPANRAMVGLMMTLRNEIIGQGLQGSADVEKVMQDELGDLWDVIKQIAKDAIASDSSEKNGEAAIKIINLIVDAANADEQPEDQSDDESNDESNDESEGDSDDESDGQSGDGAEDESDDGSGDESGESDGDSDGQSNDGSDGESGGDAESSDGSGSGSGNGGSSSGQSDDGKGDASAEDGGDDAGDYEKGTGSLNDAAKAMNALKRACEEILAASKEVFSGEVSDLVGSSYDGKMIPEAEVKPGELTMEWLVKDLSSSRAETNAERLYSRIDQLLWTKTQVVSGRRMSGARIDRRCISQSAFNPNIFKASATSDGLSTAVSIMVDVSGSTRDVDLDGVMLISSMIDAAVGVVSACERHSVPTSLIAFDDGYSIVKGFDETVSQMMRNTLDVYGGTFTSGVIPTVLQHIAAEDTDRKLVILITDGDLCDKESFLDAVNFYRELGVEVRALFFKCRDMVDNERTTRRKVDLKQIFGDLPVAAVCSGEEVVDAVFELLEESFVD